MKKVILELDGMEAETLTGILGEILEGGQYEGYCLELLEMVYRKVSA